MPCWIRRPSQVTIEFTEPVEPRLSRIDVLYDDGSIADNGDTTRDPNDSKVLHVSLKDSREGTYIVSWRALSEADGHVTSGSYVFSVGQPIDPAKAGRAEFGRRHLAARYDRARADVHRAGRASPGWWPFAGWCGGRR